MKLFRTLLTTAALTGVLTAQAQLSASPERYSPLAAGYLERARAMTDAGNFAGTIDQLRHLHTQNVILSDAEAEEYTFLLANAYYERGGKECLALLADFRRTYPASPLAPEAALAIGDWYFFQHDWPKAVEAYAEVDSDRLNRQQKGLYTYHRALSLIKTGFFAEARPLVRSLSQYSGYTDAYNFYTGYLDYINGHFNDAYSRFEKVPPGVPGLDAGYYMTQIEYSRGEYDKVITHGEGLLRQQEVPELLPEIYRVVGLSYFKKGQPEMARGFLEEYESRSGNGAMSSPDAVYALGVCDYTDGNWRRAMERFASIADEPDAIGQGASLYLGQCYLKENNPSSAALAFEKAYRRSYDRNVTEAALYNYVTALTRGGKIPFSSSADLLETFVTNYPDSEYTPKVEAYLASAYYNDREYAKALKAVNAIRRPDTSVMAVKQKVLYELGVEALSNGNAAKAAEYLRQATDLRTSDKSVSTQANLWLGDALYALGRYGEAEKAFSACVKGNPSENRALALYNLAYSQYKLGSYSSAASNFNKALAVKPTLPERLADDALIRRADCLYYTGDYRSALPLYSRAVDSEANDADYALYRRAVMQGLSGNVRAKLDDLALLERDYPSSRWLSKALLESALTFEEQGNSELAADAYKKRLQVASDVDIDELLKMSQAMYDAGRWADLLEVTDRIRHAGGLEADELADVSVREADALLSLGRTDEALAIYSELAANPSSLPGAKSAVMVAETLVADGDFEGARDNMEAFTEAGTPHEYWLARGFITLADAYQGLGQTYLAREYLSSLQDNYPGTETDIFSMISTRLKKWK